MTMLEHALRYAEQGLAVFPLKMYDKTPLTKNGCKDATKDIAIIKKWWNRYPNANIGIATGSKSNGLIVIDLDIDETKNLNGINSKMDWEFENNMFLPETVESITGRGGSHLLYQAEKLIHNRAGIYNGVDLRGEGGYIVAPPSVHPNGKVYKWVHGLDERMIATADSVVYSFIETVRDVTHSEISSTGEVQQGRRTDTLIRMIASFKGKSYPNDFIESSIRLFNDRHCNPPLSNKELATQVLPAINRMKNGESRYSVMKNDSFEGFEGFAGDNGNEKTGSSVSFVGFVGFEVPDENENPDFKNEWLPPILNNYSYELSESLQVPMDMVGVFILGMVAICVQGKHSIKPKEGWKETLNLFLAIIAESSERKTPVVSECTKPIYTYEKEENERRAPQIADYIARKEDLTNKMNAIKKATSKKKGEIDTETSINQITEIDMDINNLEKFYPFTAIADDITQEALARLMYENKGILSIVSSEGGLFSMMNGKYKNTSDYDIYLKAYSAQEPLKIHRVGRPNITVDNPILTIVLAVQPIVIETIMNNDEMNGKGLNARFLYAKPKSRVGKRRYKVKKMNQQTINAYVNTIYRLMSIPYPDKPKIIELTEGAKRQADSFFYEIENRLGEMYDSPLKTWIGKLHGQTMRIAGVLHCAELVEQSEAVLLSEKTMINAIEMGRYFLAHAEYIYKSSGLYDTPEEKEAKYILKRIEGHSKPSKPSKPITKRDLHQLCKDKTGFEKVEGLNTGLNELIRRGYIRIVKLQNPNGGRPTETIEFNPEYLKTLEGGSQ